MSEPRDFFSAVAAIGAVETLDVDAMRLLYRIEMSGEAFYDGIAARIGNEHAAALLRRNGREELGHAERLRKAIGIKLGQPFEPDASERAGFEIPLPEHVSGRMLEAILQGELDGDVGYQRWADREPDPEVQRLLRQNGREETRHGERVREVLALLGSART